MNTIISDYAQKKTTSMMNVMLAHKLPPALSHPTITKITRIVGNKDLTTMALSKPSSSMSFLVVQIRSCYPFLKAILVVTESIRLINTVAMNKANSNKLLIRFLKSFVRTMFF